MTRIPKHLMTGLVCLSVARLIAGSPAYSQSVEPVDPEDSVHHAYSVFFGSGVYRLEDRTVTVLRLPISYTFRDPEPGKPGIKFLAPVTLGLHSVDIDELLGISEADFKTVSFVPGVQFDFPMGSDWNIATAAYLGLGRDFSNDATSYIFGAAGKARYSSRVGDVRYQLGSELLLAGYRGKGEDDSQVMTRIGLGLSFEIPTRWTLRDHPMFVNPQLIVYKYGQEAEFTTLLQSEEAPTLGSEVQFRLAMGSEKPFNILGFKLDRFGLGYSYSSDDLRAIKLVVNFPF